MKRICTVLLALSVVACSPRTAENSADAMVLFPNFPLARGHSGINQLNAGLFATFTVTDASFKTIDLILAGDYAIETGTYEVTMGPKTGSPIADVGKFVAAWQKQSDGSWKMVRDVSNSDKAAM